MPDGRVVRHLDVEQKERRRFKHTWIDTVQENLRNSKLQNWEAYYKIDGRTF